jgi:hypothetical protein
LLPAAAGADASTKKTIGGEARSANTSGVSLAANASYPTGALNEMVLAQGLGDEDRQAPPA